jgi:hypothetical protein
MTEERTAAVLRVLEAELPPSTVDIDRAMRLGRRRERNRRGLAAGVLAGVAALAAAGVVTVTGDGAAPPPADRLATGGPTERTCAATPLPGTGLEATAISPDGRFVAGAHESTTKPVLWTDGPAVDLAVPAGVTATPHAVNDSGVVVGLARRGDRTLPFVVRDGGYAELALPSGASGGVAQGVGADGTVVGEAWWPDGDSRAVRWSASGAATALASTTRWAAAYAVGDDATVYGTLDDGGTPYAWGPDGAGRALPVPAGSTGGKVFGVAGDYAFGHAGALRNGRQDGAKQSGGDPRWVRWQLSTGAVTELTGLSASGVDATGAVVGSAQRDGHRYPARWRDGAVVELSTTVGGVVATSRDGTRLAGLTDGAVPTVWRC